MCKLQTMTTCFLRIPTEWGVGPSVGEVVSGESCILFQICLPSPLHTHPGVRMCSKRAATTRQAARYHPLAASALHAPNASYKRPRCDTIFVQFPHTSSPNLRKPSVSTTLQAIYLTCLRYSTSPLMMPAWMSKSVRCPNERRRQG